MAKTDTKNRRRFVVLYRDGEFAVFSSLKSASRYLGVSYNTLIMKKFPFMFRGVYFERCHLGDGNDIKVDPKQSSRDFVVEINKQP